METWPWVTITCLKVLLYDRGCSVSIQCRALTQAILDLESLGEWWRLTAVFRVPRLFRRCQIRETLSNWPSQRARYFARVSIGVLNMQFYLEQPCRTAGKYTWRSSHLETVTARCRVSGQGLFKDLNLAHLALIGGSQVARYSKFSRHSVTVCCGAEIWVFEAKIWVIQSQVGSQMRCREKTLRQGAYLFFCVFWAESGDSFV